VEKKAEADFMKMFILKSKLNLKPEDCIAFSTN
jgi:hypothetical protein